MTEQSVIDIGTKTLIVSMKVAAPALVTTLIVGIIISIFQAATQINEQTVVFIPKIFIMTLAIIFFAPWILHVMSNFTIEVFNAIPMVTR